MEPYVRFVAELDQTLYFEPLPGIVIPVKVLEISDIHVASEKVVKDYGLESETLWVQRTASGIHCTGYVAATDKNPWGFSGALPTSVLEGSRRVNQFVWIDEPVGHSIQIDDEVFLTVEEALACAAYAPRRKRLRPHKKLNDWRRKSLGFINGTRRRAGAEVDEVPRNWESKTIWVKR